MINMLGGIGINETKQALIDSVGKKIIAISQDDSRIRLTFEDKTNLILWDDGQSCCESRYITCDDDLPKFVNSIFRDLEVVNMPSIEVEYTVHEAQALNIHTSVGIIQCVTHNEHNGYYGGFWIRAELETN